MGRRGGLAGAWLEGGSGKELSRERAVGWWGLAANMEAEKGRGSGGKYE